VPERKRKALFAVVSRAPSISERRAKKLETVPGAIVDEVLPRLAPIFE
jgi:hypothetical protein